jgi:hypothetical protein
LGGGDAPQVFLSMDAFVPMVDLSSDSLEANVPIDLYTRVIQNCWTRYTAPNPDEWDSRDPGNGHHLLTALLTQEVYGGVVVAALLNGTDHLHYWNQLLSGTEFDFCRHYLGSLYTLERVDVGVTRAHIAEDVLTRFHRFRELYKAILAYERMGEKKPGEDDEVSYAFV